VAFLQAAAVCPSCQVGTATSHAIEYLREIGGTKVWCGLTARAKCVCCLLQCLGIPVLLGSCASRDAWKDEGEWRRIDSLVSATGKDSAGEGAIVLLDEGKMEIIGSGEVGFSLFEHHKVVKVLDSRGQKYANVVVPYAGRSSVDNIVARTVAPDGSVTELDPKSVYDVSLYPNFVFFSDQRAKLFTMPAVEDGAVLEYRYELTVQDRTFWHSWYFQDDVPTMLSRFTLVKPSEWQVNSKVYSLTIEPRQQRVPEGYKSTHLWEAREVPALRLEFGMPAKGRMLARLALSPLGFRQWSDVSSWYAHLSEPRTKVSGDIRAIVRRLTDGVPGESEKLRRLYDWVRERVRYLAVEVDIGGFQPHAAGDVCRNRYGDCKDMTTLLCAMAREAGIETDQVLVSTWQNGTPDTGLVSPLHFNHVIAFAPSVGTSGVWMDATEKGCPFGQLPWYDQGLPVFVVHAEGMGEWMTTPRVPPEANRVVVRWDVQLDSAGAGMVRGTTMFLGAPAVELREDLSDARREERLQWLETRLARDCPGARIDSSSFSDLGGSDDTLCISYLFRSPTIAPVRQAMLVLRPGLIEPTDLPEYFRPRERIHPVQFRFGMRKELAMDIRLPGQWAPGTAQGSDSVVSGFGISERTWDARDDVLRFRSSTTLPGTMVEPARYQEFQEFLDALREHELRELVLVRDGHSMPP